MTYLTSTTSATTGLIESMSVISASAANQAALSTPSVKPLPISTHAPGGISGQISSNVSGTAAVTTTPLDADMLSDAARRRTLLSSDHAEDAPVARLLLSSGVKVVAPKDRNEGQSTVCFVNVPRGTLYKNSLNNEKSTSYESDDDKRMAQFEVLGPPLEVSKPDSKDKIDDDGEIDPDFASFFRLETPPPPIKGDEGGKEDDTVVDVVDIFADDQDQKAVNDGPKPETALQTGSPSIANQTSSSSAAVAQSSEASYLETRLLQLARDIEDLELFGTVLRPDEKGVPSPVVVPLKPAAEPPQEKSVADPLKLQLQAEIVTAKLLIGALSGNDVDGVEADFADLIDSAESMVVNRPGQARSEGTSVSTSAATSTTSAQPGASVLMRSFVETKKPVPLIDQLPSEESSEASDD